MNLLAVLVGLGAIALQRLAVEYAWWWQWPRIHLALLLPTLVALALVPRRLGLTTTVGGPWLRILVVSGAVVLGGSVLGALLAYGAGVDPFKMVGRQLPCPDWRWFVDLCLIAPLNEELLYRVVLCSALLPLVRPRLTIVLDGLLFAGDHWLFGVQGPDNAVAGFLLAWAFLRTGSVLVPLGMHAFGNLFVMAFQAGTSC